MLGVGPGARAEIEDARRLAEQRFGAPPEAFAHRAHRRCVELTVVIGRNGVVEGAGPSLDWEQCVALLASTNSLADSHIALVPGSPRTVPTHALASSGR